MFRKAKAFILVVLFSFAASPVFALDVSAEGSSFPQVLYANAALAFYDITRGSDLFLPQPFFLPEKAQEKYRDKLGGINAPVPDIADRAEPVFESDFSSMSFEKEDFVLMVSSPRFQQKYIKSKSSYVDRIVKSLERGGQNDPEKLYKLGNAYLMQAFYLRLNECIDSYRQDPKADRSYNFNLFDLDDKAVEVFKIVVDLDGTNPYYRRSLGNVYRIKALRALADYDNPALDLSAVKNMLENSLYEYQVLSRLSPAAGSRSIGIYYLSFLPFNPDEAKKALGYLEKAGSDDLSLLALEYAYYSIYNRRDHDDAYRKAYAVYQKISPSSEVKQLAAEILN